MAKFTGDGTIIHVQDLSKTLTADVITGITNAKPAVVTPTTIGSFNNGDIVMIEKTGWSSLDNKLFVVSNATGTTFDLEGSDASGETTTAGKTATATPMAIGAGNELLEACFATISIDTQSPTTIDVSTMCQTGSLLGVAQPPTISFDGFVDPAREGFKELVRASLETPRKSRALLIEFPSNNGKIVGQFQVSNISYSAGTGAAVAFNGSGSFISTPTIIGWT